LTPGVSERVPRPMCARAPEEAPLLQGEPANGPMMLPDIVLCVCCIVYQIYPYLGQVNTQMGPMTLPDIGHNARVSDFPEIDKIPDHPDRYALVVGRSSRSE